MSNDWSSITGQETSLPEEHGSSRLQSYWPIIWRI